ncbi:MAG: sigma-54 dependent transcriptional regulator [Polyangia bacterium]
MEKQPAGASLGSEAGRRPRVLIVDDDRSMCELLEIGLRKRGFDPLWRTDPLEALELLSTEDPDVIITDLNMPSVPGTELCARVLANRPDVPVIVITAFGSLETAIAAIRAGAYDFVTKPFEVDALALALSRAVQHRALREEVKVLRRAVTSGQRFEDLVGSSPAMQKLYDLIGRVAETDVSVLITGESGTGKELVARAIHQRSTRRDGPFIAVNCSAVPEPLLESELFGHTKGAFTDARSARKGLFQQADGGTLFLDELAELPLGLQPKLLRALQERRVRPVGGDSEVAVDVRLLAATNRDLETAVEERRFREDLYFRINVVQLDLPSLRSRGGDVLLLAQHFLLRCSARSGKRVVGLSPRAAERLLAYSWPGNVRELQNCIERAVALTSQDQISIDDLPEKVRSHKPAELLVASLRPSELVTLEEIERRYILRVLEALGGNRALAAQILGVDRRTLYRKLERYGQPA